MDTELKPGDFFCTKNPYALGEAIVAVEKLQAKDGKAEYGHSGIITDVEGTTLEALTTVRGNSLDAYKGCKVIIGRWTGMTSDRYWKGMESISDNIHEKYPWWRLIIMALGFGKLKTGRYVVCSELVCKFLLAAGLEDIGQYSGQNPDDVADMIHKWKEIETVFEGTWS